MNNKYLIIGMVFLIVTCNNNDDNDNDITEDSILYSITTDNTNYNIGDTIYWNATFENNSEDTITYNDRGTMQFFDWSMIDANGEVIDAVVFNDFSHDIVVLPEEILLTNWETILDSFFYSYFIITTGTHYGLMKPWFNYDSLSYDTTEFVIE